jgi:muconolactone D-isomerase
LIFLLNIVVQFDAAVDQATRQDLLSKEQAASRQHLAEGKLRHIWRTPAQQANWSIWEVDDPTELHSLVSALPLYTWMTVSVHPLAAHPVTGSDFFEHAVTPVYEDTTQIQAPQENIDESLEVAMLVSYASKSRQRFDREYYMARHIPMVEKAWTPLGLQSTEVLFSASNDQEVTVVCLCKFSTESAMHAALAAPETAAIMLDIKQFTDITPTRCVLRSR